MITESLKATFLVTHFILGFLRKKYLHKSKSEVKYFLVGSLSLLLLVFTCTFGWKFLAASFALHFIANNCIITGITGGMGSGKSTLGHFLSTHGWTVIDSDKVAKSVLEIGTDEYFKVCNYFGPQIVDKDGRINRGLLRQRVFENQSELKFLTKIMQWNLTKKIFWQIFKNKLLLFKSRVAIESPLLFESPLRYISSPIVLVNAPIELRISRCAARDTHSTVETIRNILKCQKDPNELIPLVDIVIENDCSREKFLEKASAAFNLPQ